MQTINFPSTVNTFNDFLQRLPRPVDKVYAPRLSPPKVKSRTRHCTKSNNYLKTSCNVKTTLNIISTERIVDQLKCNMLLNIVVDK